jgi:ABC-type multidrug transport system fused ATPase/permease subunit
MSKGSHINTTGGKQLSKDCKGTISLKNVTFRYPTKKKVTVLKNVSIEVEENKVVALVGTSGCGKSSIISLIQRFYEP